MLASKTKNHVSDSVFDLYMAEVNACLQMQLWNPTYLREESRFHFHNIIFVSLSAVSVCAKSRRAARCDCCPRPPPSPPVSDSRLDRFAPSWETRAGRLRRGPVLAARCQTAAAVHSHWMMLCRSTPMLDGAAVHRRPPARVSSLPESTFLSVLCGERCGIIPPVGTHCRLCVTSRQWQASAESVSVTSVSDTSVTVGGSGGGLIGRPPDSLSAAVGPVALLSRPLRPSTARSGWRTGPVSARRGTAGVDK